MGQISVLPGENFVQYEERRSAELARSSEELMNPNSKFNEYIDDGDWVVKLRAKLNKCSIYNLKNYTNSIACAEYKNNGYSDADCLKNIFSYRKGEKPKKGSIILGFILLLFLLCVLMGLLTFAAANPGGLYGFYGTLMVIPVVIFFIGPYSSKLDDGVAGHGGATLKLVIKGTFDEYGNLHVSQYDYDWYKRKCDNNYRTLL